MGLSAAPSWGSCGQTSILRSFQNKLARWAPRGLAFEHWSHRLELQLRSHRLSAECCFGCKTKIGWEVFLASLLPQVRNFHLAVKV